MYNGEGLEEESSSCKNVGMDIGGIGMTSGIGEGGCCSYRAVFALPVNQSVFNGAGGSLRGFVDIGSLTEAEVAVDGFVEDLLRLNIGVDWARDVTKGLRDSDIVLSLVPALLIMLCGSNSDSKSSAELAARSRLVLPARERASFPRNTGRSARSSTGDKTGEAFATEGGGDDSAVAVSTFCDPCSCMPWSID